MKTITRGLGGSSSRRSPTGVWRWSFQRFGSIYSFFYKITRCYAYFGLNFCFKTKFCFTVMCDGAPPKPAPRVYFSPCYALLSLLRHHGIVRVPCALRQEVFLRPPITKSTVWSEKWTKKRGRSKSRTFL